MAGLENEIFDKLLARLAGRSEVPAAAAAVPPTPAPVSEKERAQAVTAIISEAYAMPGVPEHVRRRCAKRRIEAEYGAECAAKYLRGRKRNKVPAGQIPTEATEAPPEAEPAKAPEVAAAVPAKAPEAISEPAKPPTEPVLALDSEMRKRLGVKETPAPSQ